ncbi:MAG: iron-containing alcohol dehydrogenase [Victivallales bacterium]|nr:iron-containing alcohol dehydrogenase [Victivallales bacterium]
MHTTVSRELRKFLAPEFIFGIGARMKAGVYASNLGMSRVLLVTDPGIVAAGWLKDVQNSLREEGIKSTVFSKVSPNPRDCEVMSGMEQYRASDCNGIIALGGGSPMDCAKGIAIMVSNPGHILDYEGVDMISMPGPPLLCIPTTSGTAADVSQFAIILDTSEHNKIAIISKAIVPDVSLVDPEITVSMNPFLTACTGMDAMTHAVEAACSNASSPVTDLYAYHAIELVADNIKNAVENPNDLNARYNMSLASLEAGLAFSNASLGAVHAMAHSLGGFLDLPHGKCNAILLPHVMDFNFQSAVECFKKIGEKLKLSPKLNTKELRRELMQTVNGFNRKLGITDTLGDMGVKSSDIPELAEKAVDDPCLLTNPRQAGIRDLESIYEEAS